MNGFSYYRCLSITQSEVCRRKLVGAFLQGVVALLGVLKNIQQGSARPIHLFQLLPADEQILAYGRICHQLDFWRQNACMHSEKFVVKDRVGIPIDAPEESAQGQWSINSYSGLQDTPGCDLDLFTGVYGSGRPFDSSDKRLHLPAHNSQAPLLPSHDCYTYTQSGSQ